MDVLQVLPVVLVHVLLSLPDDPPSLRPGKPRFGKRFQESLSGRSLPAVTTACAAQVKCKQLASRNGTDLSVVVQIGGKSMKLRSRLSAFLGGRLI